MIFRSGSKTKPKAAFRVLFVTERNVMRDLQLDREPALFPGASNNCEMENKQEKCLISTILSILFLTFTLICILSVLICLVSLSFIPLWSLQSVPL